MKTKYITAEEARKQLDDLSTEKAMVMKDMSNKMIRNAVDKGLSEVNLDIEYNFFPQMEKWLEGLGYTVDCGNEQRDGKWFKVSW